MPEALWLVIGAVVGVALGFVIARFLVNASTKRAAQEAESVVADAKRQAETLRREALIEAKDQALKYKQEAEAENKERLPPRTAFLNARSRSTAVSSRSMRESIRSRPCRGRSSAASMTWTPPRRRWAVASSAWPA